MSGQRALGDCMHGFEEMARWLPLIGEGEVNLEMRLGAAHGQSLDDQPGAPSLRQQHVGIAERRIAPIMHDDATGGRGLTYLPFRRHAPERVAAGPARGVERFELELGGPAQYPANDEDITTAAPPGR